MKEFGLQDREYKQFYSPKPKCSQAGGTFKKIGLIDLYYAFLVLVFGVGVSFGLLLLETYLTRFKNQPKNIPTKDKANIRIAFDPRLLQ